MNNKWRSLVLIGCLALAPAAFAVPFTMQISYSGTFATTGAWSLLGPTPAGGTFYLTNGQTAGGTTDINQGYYVWSIGGAGYAGGTFWSLFLDGALVDSGSAAGDRTYLFGDGGTFSVVPEPGTLALLGLGLLGVGWSARRRGCEA